jgi:hypothetical protein
MCDKNEVAMGDNGKDVFLTINGMKIAKRENHQWTSLVPGYTVRDYGDLDGISVEVDPSCSQHPAITSGRT